MRQAVQSVCAMGWIFRGRGGGWGGVYRSPRGACATAAGAGGVSEPRKPSVCHTRSPQPAASQATAYDSVARIFCRNI
ncbi:unnamed protein product [Arctia plantaginis]|uniref:Uncharacterized protein n=1 Tax=Arctia plantaginis TaxID=874455 RepID=A0A8S0ZIL4_ARCPL|nr:unnamed protein product [Arctia plantaginis]